jgi:hypothetical protein
MKQYICINSSLFLALTSILNLSMVNAICNIYLQSNNLKYLNTSLMQLYNISDPCTTTCADGYYGDFCQDLTKYSKLPMGPWNQAGYCTSGEGIMRSMSIDVTGINSIQYTRKDSVLIGITNGGYDTSVVSEISLYDRAITPVLLPTPSGALDALIVRKGVVYVARSIKVNGAVKYDVATLNSPWQAQTLMPITVKAALIEVCSDKGTITAFVYGSNKVTACYPNGVCNIWLSSISTISGMMSGADCKDTLYASSFSDILRITSTGYSVLRSTPTTIYCLTGIPEINVLLYKSKNNMWQINLGTGISSSLPLGATQTQEVVCSADVSENSNQILIVQKGIINTLEAVQQPCSFGQTSLALLCNSTSQCTACPPPPSNSFVIEGSVTCEWTCLQEYTRIGSKCVLQVVQPCPDYYRASTDYPGLCVPSVIPWADQGKYVTVSQYSAQQALPIITSPPYLLTSEGSTLIQATSGKFFMSKSTGNSWSELVVSPFITTNCPYDPQNSYYYLSSRRRMLWVAFTTQRVEGIQHCLWAVNATGPTSPQGTLQLKVMQAWALNSQLCSATGDGEAVYAIQCGYNYISYAKLQSGSLLSPAIGNPIPGYSDGDLLAAKLNRPSSLVAYDSRLYIADTGNCVIREVDLIRGTVRTVTGTQGLCERVDGTGNEAALVFPTNLINTPYDGFFLFVDKYTNEATAVIRQFHALTARLSTVQILPRSYFTGITVSSAGIFVLAQHLYYIFNASWDYCPAGTSSLQGNAFAPLDCLTCPAFSFSDTASGTCKPCSSPKCTLPGQLLVACQLNSDAYCGYCTNKPVNNSKYIGASSIPGTQTGGGDCAWVYTPPCPIGYYNSTDGMCSSCPRWSTTANSGSRSVSNCSCIGGGKAVNGSSGLTCVIPSPLSSFPAICSPIERCQAYTEPSIQFPVLPSCTSFDTDSYTGVCPCQPGEYIQQIYPKNCAACPSGLYSPSGRGCRVCPYLTEPSSDQSTCRCAAGTRDVALTQAEPYCVCGPGKAFQLSVGCIQCPKNTYNAAIREYTAVGSMQCTQCPTGTWSTPAASACVPCPMGEFRQQSDTACQSCPMGFYATDPSSPLCVECSSGCNGRKESQCPTNKNLFMCSDCQAPRANSEFNGQRDCATSCNPGFYELDGECVLCTEYSRITCPAGNSFVECSSYADAGCLACVNTSMPLNFAVWSYVSATHDGLGPSSVCEWECEAGYSPQRPTLPNGIQAAWGCAREGDWSVWDLFTL